MALPDPRRGAMRILSTPALLIALLAALLAATAGRAAADELFTVPGVKVDVTADSAAEARETALAEGQRAALQRLLMRLALAEDVARLPHLSDREIAQMVHDFQIESEQTSSVRYIGDLTFRFRADAVRHLLEQNGIRFAAIGSKPVLVLPVLATEGGGKLWEDPNPWREAWAAWPATDGLVPLVVPLGDLGDLAVIDAAGALAGDPAKLSALANRYGTGDVIVAEAQIAETQAAETGEEQLRLDISAKRYAEGAVRETYTDSLTGSAAEREALFARGVERLDEMVQEAWKQANLVSFGAEQTLIATVPISRMSDWVAVRNRLADIAIVRNAEILYLMRNEGRLRLTFAGDATQLSRALAQQDLSLSPAPDELSGGLPGELWVLRLGSGSSTEPSPGLSGPASAAQPSSAAFN